MSIVDKLSLWMRFGQPLEPVIEGYERVFDGWQAGGVTGIVFGRLLFVGERGTPATFDPNPAIYREMDVEPPVSPDETHPERRKLLEAALTNAKERGLGLFVFSPDAGQGSGGEGHPLVDDRSLAARVARIRDVMEAYPMVDGGVLDGPELGYEITPGHRSNIFEDTPDTLRSAATDLGFDFDAMVAARDRFERKLHDLNPTEIDLRSEGGFLGTFELLDSDVDLVGWFAFRRALLMDYYRRQHQAFEQMPRTVRIGVGSRLPCFTPLNGYDLAVMADLYSFILPKLYFFHRGFDGFYGTVGRYIQTLTAWNPGLSDAHAMKVVEGLFGIQLPWVRSRLDLEMGFPPEFFETFVPTEVRRMLAASTTPDSVIPWVEAGREPHHGDPISAGDLHRYLTAAREAGLERFLYHSHTHLTEGEWAVVTNLCGEPWYSGKPGYAPFDQMKRPPLHLLLLCGCLADDPTREAMRTEVGPETAGSRTQKTSAPLKIDPEILANRAFNEAPMLAERVIKGQLPPVSERLPENPLVVVPLDEIGQYGGTINRALTGEVVQVSGISKTLSENLMGYERPLPHRILHNLAESHTFLGDGKEAIFRLRKGLRWSDGVPFTVDDILFWYYDMWADPDARRSPLFPTQYLVEGEPIEMERIDDHTIRFRSHKPLGGILHNLSQDYISLPKHIFARYHPRYNPESTYEILRDVTTRAKRILTKPW